MRYLIMLGGLIFTLDHPLLVALGTVFYMINLHITKEEKQMLRDFASKGSVWLTNLNKVSREHGFSMKGGREISSDIITSLFNSIPKKDLETFFSNDINKDKINKFVISQLKEDEICQTNWEAFPLKDSDLLEEDEKKFIKALVPDFDWGKPYSFKEHRKLFKILKSKFRNIDGTINDELGNSTVLELEDLIYSFMIQKNTELYGTNQEITEYLMREDYKKYV